MLDFRALIEFALAVVIIALGLLLALMLSAHAAEEAGSQPALRGAAATWDEPGDRARAWIEARTTEAALRRRGLGLCWELQTRAERVADRLKESTQPSGHRAAARPTAHVPRCRPSNFVSRGSAPRSKSGPQQINRQDAPDGPRCGPHFPWHRRCLPNKPTRRTKFVSAGGRFLPAGTSFANPIPVFRGAAAGQTRPLPHRGAR